MPVVISLAGLKVIPNPGGPAGTDIDITFNTKSDFGDLTFTCRERRRDSESLDDVIERAQRRLGAFGQGLHQAASQPLTWQSKP
jgi:hypothetical protein